MHVAECNRGFSLIELLVVLAILGVLAAIAIPSYLGTKDKARLQALVSSAKDGESEIRSLKWAYGSGEPFLALDPSMNMKCFESQAVDSKNKCSKLYPDIGNVGLYNNTSLDGLVDIIVDNYKGKNFASPYGVSPFLFVSHNGTVGTIAVSAYGRYIKLSAYGLDTVAPVYNSII